jgi:hypothetical protein
MRRENSATLRVAQVTPQTQSPPSSPRPYAAAVGAANPSHLMHEDAWRSIVGQLPKASLVSLAHVQKKLTPITKEAANYRLE